MSNITREKRHLNLPLKLCRPAWNRFSDSEGFAGIMSFSFLNNSNNACAVSLFLFCRSPVKRLLLNIYLFCARNVISSLFDIVIFRDKAKICAHQLQKMLDASFQNHNDL